MANPKNHHLDRRAGRLVAEGTDGDPNALLTTVQVASWLGVSRQWLEIGRCHGYGARFCRIGPRKIMYRRSDLLAWLTERTYACTKEYAPSTTAIKKEK